MTENERVREIRKENGFTMAEFGTRLGVTKSAISRIESGGCSVSLRMRRFICREFHIREEWLETGNGEKYVKWGVEEEMREAVAKLLEGENPELRLRLVKIIADLSDMQIWAIEVKLWEILTGEMLPVEQVKERLDFLSSEKSVHSPDNKTASENSATT